MSISPIIAQGFGSFGGVNFVPTLGFTSSSTPVVTTTSGTTSTRGISKLSGISLANGVTIVMGVTDYE